MTISTRPTAPRMTMLEHPAQAPAPAPAPSPTSPGAPAAAPVETEGVPSYLAPDVVQQRTEAARRAELTADVIPDDVLAKGAPAYFRSYEQLKGAMYDLQAKYPDLVEVRDIGDTWEKTQGTADRDVLALVLTNRKNGGSTPKPSAMHIGGVHAREIANPEMLMTFGQQLLEGYGRDADSTMLLDSREIILVPMVNADGHAMVERGYAGAKDGDLMKRKNTSGPGGEGTDLNRNFDFHWGGPGASSSPGSETYRGPSASSEPETKAIDAFVGARRPSFFMDWHSYSKLNMYPWGDTKEPTKDHVGFKALAEKMSTWNHYSPIQSIALYPTTGTTDDTAYGKYGVPSMAVETGSSFHQSDSEFAQTLRENLPVLTYTAKVADAPFQRVLGPDTLEVVVDPTTKQVSARVSDAGNGKQAIAGAEIVMRTDAAPGSGVQLTPADGSFDATDERVTGSAARVPGLAPGAGDGTLVYVRAKDSAGNWGPLTAQWLTGPKAAAAALAPSVPEAAHEVPAGNYLG